MYVNIWNLWKDHIRPVLILTEGFSSLIIVIWTRLYRSRSCLLVRTKIVKLF